jgi:hypothetical protein
MAEGMHLQQELENIAYTQRKIEAHKLELARMEQLEKDPDLWLPPLPVDPSAAAVIQEVHLELYVTGSLGSVRLPVSLS